MCGISGIINFNKELVNKKSLQLMMDKMKHRGPDDEGIYVDSNIGLGFVRLSILDLSLAGHQPMVSGDGKSVIIFNGEVYNYLEIRNELKSKYKFRTGTDTEVVLTAYKEWGEACLDRFNGMFAFAIYNIESKEIFIARDRFGIKPFYYYKDNNKFIFASEIKSILPLLDKKEANDKIIYDYLLFNRTDHTQETFFKNIFKLQHGTWLKINGKEIESKRWYNVFDKTKEEKYVSKEEFRGLFKESLKLRLRADVPIGVSLSGGIDSSCITTSLVNDFDLTELNTFSAVYGKAESSDESEYIDEFRSMIKNMHFISPDSDIFYNDIESFIAAHNEPVPDIGPYAQFKVMELASKYVTVTLDGQGADEQLAGYHYFFGSYYIELLKEMKLLTFLSENIEYLRKHKTFDSLKYFFYYLLPSSYQQKLNSKVYPSINKKKITKNLILSDVNRMLYSPNNLNESLKQHFEYKLEHLLRWEDLNSMHFSIEARVPFLDHRLVEAVLSTPSKQKINKADTKHLLRQALKDILPEKIVNRRDKKGFSNPRDKWFKTSQFKKFIIDLIKSKEFKDRGYFDSDICLSQYNKHLKGEIDASKEIWKWINLEIWFRKFIDLKNEID